MKIGLLVGMEDSFPKALIARLEELGGSDVDAHMLSLGGTHHDELCDYDVIVDRVSHDVEFYQSHLRHARLAGTRVLNDPFLVPRDDRFFDCSFATRIGVHVPRTVLLPQKDYPDTVTGASLRNLAWPIPWDEHLEFVGLPAVLRPVGLRGWRHLARIGNRDELLAAYDRTGTTCMMLQEAISWSRYVRCLVFGGDRVIVTRYDPEYRQYLNDPDYVEADLEERIVADAARIATGLGYEMCSVEFAIREDEPVAVEFVNPAPDLERSVITPFFFEKVVETMAAYCLEVAGQGRVVPQVDPFTPGAGLIARISRPGARGGRKLTAKKPAGKQGVAKKPAGRKPTAKKPAAKKPAAKKPAAKKPAAKKPAAKKRTAKKPAAKKPSTKKPAPRRPAAKKPLGKRSSP